MSRRPWSPEDRDKAWRLHCSGRSLKAIGRLLNRSPNSVYTSLEATRRANAEKKRPCLCCGTPFNSAGPHNRLCHVCRRRDVSPYAL